MTIDPKLGEWAGGAYFPGDFDFSGPEAAADAGQPYTATTWALLDLRDWGVDAAALAGTAEFRWFYSVLGAADYFRAAALHDGTAPDPRLAEAMHLIRAARGPDGTWLQARRHPGRVWFEVDVPAGEPSKWLTFYGTRVLDWWDSATGS